MIKIPNFTYCHLHWLQGCYGNWSERYWYKRTLREDKLKMSPSYFCSWFGLFQIQAKFESLERELIEEEIEYFRTFGLDNKKENFGMFKGKLVCLDYP